MSLSARQPTIFLDRDGVIVENRADYVKTLDEVVMLPGVLAALAQAAPRSWRFVVVTNQSAIGRGLLAVPTLAAINAHIDHLIVAAGGRIDGWYYCPHRPEDGCECRKPKPGLLLAAAADLNLDLTASVMIGDALSDVLAGHAAGAQSVLVRTGRGERQVAELLRAGLSQVPVVADLAAALQWIAAEAVFTKTPP
jgi:D-glycero-D-manno-heptose 1,7-bisphosphate phosphatase